MAAPAQKTGKKKATKVIAVTRAQLGAGVPVPTGRKVKLVMGKTKFAFSA
jgi:hypothetical protein